jgi:hypothetical protein
MPYLWQCIVWHILLYESIRRTNCTINLYACTLFRVRAIVNDSSINCHLLLADVSLVLVVVPRLSLKSDGSLNSLLEYTGLMQPFPLCRNTQTVLKFTDHEKLISEGGGGEGVQLNKRRKIWKKINLYKFKKKKKKKKKISMHPVQWNIKTDN